MERQLSPHVASRWYRSPELILTERNYGSKSDMWSAGCIFGECLSFTNAYVRKGGREIQKRVLFPGSSCFPISPCQRYEESCDSDTTRISENDQLIKIFDQLGQLDGNDFSFLSDKTAIEYAEQVSSQRKGQTLSKRFSESSSEIVEILEALLEFNQQFRVSAKELLKHKIFDDIRVERLERGAPYQIHLLCDAMDSFNYS